MYEFADALTFPWGLAQRAWSVQDGAAALAVILWAGLGVQLMLAAYPKPMTLRASVVLLATYPGMLLLASAGVVLRVYGVIHDDELVFWALMVLLISMGVYFALSQKAWFRGVMLALLLLPHAGLTLMSVNEDFWPPALLEAYSR